MSDDWKAGDLALCVSNAPRPDNDAAQRACLASLRRGQIYEVSGVGRATQTGPTIFLRGLAAAYEDRGAGWMASRFVKHRPYAERFADQLRKGGPGDGGARECLRG